jgi:Ca2+-binding RTX toxin-like protein
MNLKLLFLSGLLAALFALLSAPARAATVVNKSGGELVVTAAPAKTNTIGVSLVGATYFVTDSGDTVAPAPGSGCLPAGNPNTVTCSTVAVARVAVLAGDRNDSVTVATNVGARIDGGADNDSVNAGPVAGSALLSGGPGIDTLLGGPNADRLEGGTGPDVLDGGGGQDRADYSARAAGVTVTLDGLANDGEPGEGDNAKTSVEDIVGGSGGDTLNGGPGPNTLWGLGGADVINGLGADDTLVGGAAADVLNGNDGHDTFRAEATPDGGDVFQGGAGTDHLDYSLRTTPVTVDLDGNADDGAAAESDNARTDIEDLTGGSAFDVLAGSAASNTLDGGAGPDDLDGLGENDRLRGQAGDDDLDGGAGNDFLQGGDDDDYLMGGPGSDGLRGENGDDFLAGPRDGDGDSLHGGPGADECGGDYFDSQTSCEGG